MIWKGLRDFGIQELCAHEANSPAIALTNLVFQDVPNVLLEKMSSTSPG